MSTIRQVRDGFATALTAINGLRATALITDTINPPVAVVYRKGVDYDLVYADGPAEYQFGIRVYADRVDERSSQDLLDSYCLPTGVTSVKAAVDGTLGGVVDYAVVRRVSETSIAELPSGVSFLVIEFDVEVVY